jgi:osmotically-inducible protein OsmY
MKTLNGERRACHGPTIRRPSVVLLAALVVQALILLPLQAAPVKKPVDDQSITYAVENEFLFRKGVSPNFINVSTSQGIVTLSGSVDNLLAKDRAVKIAESVRHVRAVIDKLSVTPTWRPDEDIRKDVQTALHLDPVTESDQITVAVKNAAVTLSGSVGSWPEAQLARRIAMRVKGAKQVTNEIAINYRMKRTDEEIAADIKSALRWDIWLNGEFIDVHVNNGQVTLIGTVGSAAAKTRAVSDAWVNGVTAVDDSGLMVDPWARDQARRRFKYVIKSSDEIKQAVLAAFRRDPRVAPFSLSVRVEDNTAILSGAVGNLRAKVAAERDARDTVGVWWVNNLLKVRPKNWPSDADTERNVNVALLWDALLSNTQIQVAVINHVAYLSGVVDDRFQKVEAQDIASRTQGVAEVRNRIHVEPGYTVSEYNSYYNWPEYYGGPFYSGSWLSATVPLPSDKQIRKAIQKSFFWSPFVRSREIKVRVHHGVVVLTGTVDGCIAYNEASRDARKSGAVAVVNHLHIKKGAWF